MRRYSINLECIQTQLTVGRILNLDRKDQSQITITKEIKRLDSMKITAHEKE